MKFQNLVCKFYTALVKSGYDDSYDAKIGIDVNEKRGIIKYEDQGGSFEFTFTPNTIKTYEVCVGVNGQTEIVQETYTTFEEFVDMFCNWYNPEIKSYLK